MQHYYTYAERFFTMQGAANLLESLAAMPKHKGYRFDLIEFLDGKEVKGDERIQDKAEFVKACRAGRIHWQVRREYLGDGASVTDGKCNGWSNWVTWSVHVWSEHDAECKHLKTLFLQNEPVITACLVKQFVLNEMVPHMRKSGETVISNLNAVNWEELAVDWGLNAD